MRLSTCPAVSKYHPKFVQHYSFDRLFSTLFNHMIMFNVKIKLDTVLRQTPNPGKIGGDLAALFEFSCVQILDNLARTVTKSTQVMVFILTNP